MFSATKRKESNCDTPLQQESSDPLAFVRLAISKIASYSQTLSNENENSNAKSLEFLDSISATLQVLKHIRFSMSGDGKFTYANIHFIFRMSRKV